MEKEKETIKKEITKKYEDLDLAEVVDVTKR